jgi:hypothetical protein
VNGKSKLWSDSRGRKRFQTEIDSGELKPARDFTGFRDFYRALFEVTMASIWWRIGLLLLALAWIGGIALIIYGLRRINSKRNAQNAATRRFVARSLVERGLDGA